MEKAEVKLLMIGGSAGSIEVLMQVLPTLIPQKKFAIIIVLHRKGGEDSMLEELISAKTRIPVQEIEDKTPLKPGFIYVAPADYHLLFEKNNTLSLDNSEKVNYSRPSIDIAFESAADAFGKNVTAILLSGANSDGTAGMKAIKKSGGKIIVQEPDSAEMPFMPQHALNNTEPDYTFNVDEISAFISQLSG